MFYSAKRPFWFLLEKFNCLIAWDLRLWYWNLLQSSKPALFSTAFKARFAGKKCSGAIFNRKWGVSVKNQDLKSRMPSLIWWSWALGFSPCKDSLATAEDVNKHLGNRGLAHSHVGLELFYLNICPNKQSFKWSSDAWTSLSGKHWAVASQVALRKLFRSN